jgi:hypothetical protein
MASRLRLRRFHRRTFGLGDTIISWNSTVPFVVCIFRGQHVELWRLRPSLA